MKAIIKDFLTRFSLLVVGIPLEIILGLGMILLVGVVVSAMTVYAVLYHLYHIMFDANLVQKIKERIY